MTKNAIDPAMRDAVLARLASVRAEHGVAIPLAVESGSRAWGFPSADSDYDCRFIYLRPQEQYLDPWPPRDVIDTPLDAVLDVNGWDLIKVVRLLVKGNATVLEWLASSVDYHRELPFQVGLTELAAQVADRASLVRHYTSLAVQARAQWRADEPVRLKRVFYAVRPAATVRWLRTYPTALFAPIDLPTLLAESGAATEVCREIAELTEVKAATREAEMGTVPDVIGSFVDTELDRGAPEEHMRDAARARRLAAEYFRRAVDNFAP